MKMGYQELSVYLWHVLDTLYKDGTIAEGAIILDVGGFYSEWGWFFENRNVERFDAINYLLEPHDIPPVRELPLDAHNLQSLEAESYDFALSLETLEHLYDPVRVVNEMTRLLKVGGVIFLSGMCAYGYHPEPHCYWHVYPDGMSYMLRDFDIAEIIGYGGSEKDPMGVWAWGTKREGALSSEELMHIEANPFYRHIQTREVLESFLAERGYIYKSGIEMLKDKDGRVVGQSPDLTPEMLEKANE